MWTADRTVEILIPVFFIFEKWDQNNFDPNGIDTYQNYFYTDCVETIGFITEPWLALQLKDPENTNFILVFRKP